MQTAPCSNIFHPRRGAHHPHGRPLAVRGQGTTAQIQGAAAQDRDTRPVNPSLRRLHAQAGGTLVEVVVAVAIIAVMSGGLIGSLSYGFLATQLARENQRATQILLEKAEVIRLYNWDQFNYTNNFVPRTFTDIYDPQASNTAPGITYYGTLTVADFPAGPSYADNLRQINISLTWTTANRVVRSRMLTTQVAKNGLQNYVY